jgi:citrate lyase beta subunit
MSVPEGRARTLVPEAAAIVARGGIALGTTRLVAMVETAAAFFRIAEIARAHPRLCGLTLGAEDFATSAGIMAEPEALTMPKQMAVFAARAAGIMPLALSARSPSFTTSTYSGRRSAARAGSGLSARRSSIRARCRS